MPKTFISALTSVLHDQVQFTVADALNDSQRAAALIPHSHNGWELLMFSDEKIQLNPPKVLHDSPPDVILSIEIDMLKISCRDYASGEVRTWGIPADKTSAISLISAKDSGSAGQHSDRSKPSVRSSQFPSASK